MQYWQSVLDEVSHKDDNAHTFLTPHGVQLTNRVDALLSDDALNFSKETRELRSYYLGDDYPNVYLTKREAETMFWIVQELTIAEAAEKMHLSARTVEFYVKNMKLKLSCANKKELIEKVLDSDLLQQLEKEGLQIISH